MNTPELEALESLVNRLLAAVNASEATGQAVEVTDDESKEMMMLTANDIYSVRATEYDGFWATCEFANRTVKAEAVQRSDDETDQEMRDAGYVYIENSYQFGKELWVSAEDLQA